MYIVYNSFHIQESKKVIILKDFLIKWMITRQYLRGGSVFSWAAGGALCTAPPLRP